MTDTDSKLASIEYVTVPRYTCMRCGKQWISKRVLTDPDLRPVACPGCNSPYWDRPRRIESKAKKIIEVVPGS